MIETVILWVWVGLVVFSFILEAITQDFISIWFTLGALVALCLTSVCVYWIEILIFSVVSLLALILTRPLVRKFTARTERYTNVDEFVGKRVKVEKEISKFDAGEIKVNGIVYTAILMEDEEESIEKDCIVEIVTMKGNKVVVKKLEN